MRRLWHAYRHFLLPLENYNNGNLNPVKEILFIRQNIKEWQHIEAMTSRLDIETPDDISAAYIRVTSDLAFAQTHYPSSRITQYLNNLSAVLHNAIYRNKRENRRRIITFWTQEVPLVMYGARRLLLLSAVIFLLSALVGVVSQLAVPDFCRYILGDSYMDTTMQNILEGKPFDIYASGSESDMFGQITANNIRVSFVIYISGLFTSLSTAAFLFSNGVMVGCFETFFAQHGLLGQSLLAVMLHGTLELSAIVVAGAAGLAMGNGWLFPGTYSRIVSFRRAAKRGLKIVVGTVPVFVVAGFIEGYITRHTEVADALRLTFILLSAAFVVFYYIVYPYRLHKKQIDNNKNQDYENITAPAY